MLKILAIVFSSIVVAVGGVYFAEKTNIIESHFFEKPTKEFSFVSSEKGKNISLENNLSTERIQELNEKIAQAEKDFITAYTKYSTLRLDIQKNLQKGFECFGDNKDLKKEILKATELLKKTDLSKEKIQPKNEQVEKKDSMEENVPGEEPQKEEKLNESEEEEEIPVYEENTDSEPTEVEEDIPHGF